MKRRDRSIPNYRFGLIAGCVFNIGLGALLFQRLASDKDSDTPTVVRGVAGAVAKGDNKKDGPPSHNSGHSSAPALTHGIGDLRWAEIPGDRISGLDPNTIQIDPFSGIAPLTIEALMLTPAEVEGVLGATRDFMAKIQATEAKCLRLEEIKGVGMRCVIPPYSDEVEFHAQALRKTLYQVVDPARAEVLTGIIVRQPLFCAGVGQTQLLSISVGQGSEAYPVWEAFVPNSDTRLTQFDHPSVSQYLRNRFMGVVDLKTLQEETVFKTKP